MKKFNAKWILDRSRMMESWNDPKKPAPFPGKFPTRIAVQIYQENKPVYEYCGKPNEVPAKMVLKYLARVREVGHIRAVEFDRKNLIAVGASGFNGRTALNPTAVNACLYRYYYPWSARQAVTQFSQPLWIKRIRNDGKVHRVYSPLETLRIEENLRPYKLWLKEMGI